MMAFAGTRTQHRMAVAIEDAGFEIRDMIAWCYGNRFPKSHNLDDAWAGWGTALKPALEPITMARKPFKGTVAANVLEHGTGALNVDGCRVHGPDALAGRKRHGGGIAENHSSYVLPDSDHESPAGRWPANLIHDGSEEVVGLFPEQRNGGANVSDTRKAGASTNILSGTGWSKPSNAAYANDTGSAARFFYTAKVTRAERQGVTHPTVKPLDLMAYLCRLVTPSGGTVLDPFMGSGTTIKAAISEGFNAIGIERDPAYFAMAEHRMNGAQLGLGLNL
jgi:site-specific DNA-methyltransferase (adenine-specific)